MAEGRYPARGRKEIWLTDDQAVVSVQANENTALKEILAKIVSAGVNSTGRVIQRGPE